MDILELLKLANQPGIQSIPLLVVFFALLHSQKVVRGLQEDQVRGFKDGATQYQKLAEKVDSAVHTLGQDLALLRQEVRQLTSTKLSHERRLRSVELFCAKNHGLPNTD